MTEGELETYVGEYREEKGGWTLIIERDGRELKLIFPASSRNAIAGHTNAVPTGNHIFVDLTYRAMTMEFIVENGTVTQLVREAGVQNQSNLQRYSKKR